MRVSILSCDEKRQFATDDTTTSRGHPVTFQPERFSTDVWERPRSLNITAKCTTQNIKGTRGGTPKKTVHDFALMLDSNDLGIIVKAALTAKLLPASTDVANALETLVKALSEMGITR